MRRERGDGQQDPAHGHSHRSLLGGQEVDVYTARFGVKYFGHEPDVRRPEGIAAGKVYLQAKGSSLVWTVFSATDGRVPLKEVAPASGSSRDAGRKV